MLNMTCHIRSNKCNQTSADIAFEFELLNRSIVNASRRYIHVINITTAELNYPNIERYFHQAIITCLVRGHRKCRETVDDKLVVGCELMLVCFSLSFFTRDSMSCFSRLNHRLGVCPSVCPSVTPWHCIKMATPRIMKSSLLAAARTLVYRNKISCPLDKWIPLERGRQRGVPPKKTLFCRYWLV